MAGTSCGQIDNPGVKHSFTPGTMRRAREKGITIIELMVALVVLAVLLAVGVPSFQSFTASSRLTTASNELVGSLALARSEAVRRGARVTVCKSANGAACVTTGTWAQGWIVFVDNARPTATASIDAGDVVLSQVPALSADVSMAGDGGTTNFVSFSAQGDVRLMNGTPQSGRVRVCSTAGSVNDDRRARDIAIGTTGRLSTTTPPGVDASCPLS